MLIHTVAAISEDVIEDFRLYLLRAAASKSSFMKAMESMQVGFKTVSQEDFIASYCSTLPPSTSKTAEEPDEEFLEVEESVDSCFQSIDTISSMGSASDDWRPDIRRSESQRLTRLCSDS